MNKKITVLFSIALLFAAIAHTQPPQQPKPPSDEEKLKHVSEKINKEITLTAAQKTKVETAYKVFFVEMEKLRKTDKNGKPEMPPPPPPGKKEDVDKLTKARDIKIKAALSETQYKKYTEIEQTLRPPRPGGGGKQRPLPSQKP